MHVGWYLLRHRGRNRTERWPDRYCQFCLLLRRSDERRLPILRGLRLRFQGHLGFERETQRSGHHLLHGIAGGSVHHDHGRNLVQTSFDLVGRPLLSCDDGLGCFYKIVAGEPEHSWLGGRLWFAGLRVQHLRDLHGRQVEPCHNSIRREFQQGCHDLVVSLVPRGELGARVAGQGDYPRSAREHHGLQLVQRSEEAPVEQRLMPRPCVGSRYV
mmetsp:Transcript_79399/g.199492  ORF Transcript_79399/g.199492 Transcript_79399/m.199492 type:complete len:214 (-) Transcript_79399:55-696(-)